MSTFRGSNSEKSIKSLVEYLEETYNNISENKRTVVLKQVEKSDNKIIIKVDSLSPEKMNDADEILTEIKNMIRIIKTPEEELMMRKEIFDDFPILSDYIQVANFNIHDIYQIIVFFIERNIKSCITEDAITIDMNVLKNLKFETMNINELLKKIMDGKINDFMNSDKEDLTELEQNQIEELNRRLPEFTRSLNSVRKYTLDFEKYVLNKMPNILIEDIVEAKIALRGLNCTDYIIEKITLYLLRIYEKNLKNQTELLDIDLNDVYINILFPLKTDENGEYIHDEVYYKNQQHKNLIRNQNRIIASKNKAPEAPKVVEKKYLTEEDVRNLNKVIRKFYSLYNIEIISIPNYDELVQVIEAMEKLEIDPLEIRRFLTKLLALPTLPDSLINTEKELLTIANKLIKYKIEEKVINAFIRRYRYKFHKTYDNSIEEYLDRIEEIRFYDQEIESDIAELYTESLTADQEDYLIIDSMIREYLNMLSKYNTSVNYEYNLAKNLK